MPLEVVQYVLPTCSASLDPGVINARLSLAERHILVFDEYGKI